MEQSDFSNPPYGPYLLVDPVDDSGVLLGAVDRRLDAVLQQRVENPILLDGVGVHALEAPHRQLREPVRKPLSIACYEYIVQFVREFLPLKILIEIVQGISKECFPGCENKG